MIYITLPEEVEQIKEKYLLSDDNLTAFVDARLSRPEIKGEILRFSLTWLNL